jgi:hypothetical protein
MNTTAAPEKKRRMNKWLKRGLITGGVAIGLVLITLITAPIVLYYRQDYIATWIVDYLNEHQLGHTEVEKIYISPFKNFPYISIDLHNLRFYGDRVERKNLIYQFEDVYAGFNVWDIITGKYDLKKIRVQNGKLHLIRDKDGNINLLLAKDDGIENAADSTEAAPLHLDLRKIELRNINFIKEDQGMEQMIEVQIAKSDLSFKYIGDKIENHLDMDLTIQHLSLHGLDFFKNKHIDIVSDVTFHSEKNFLEIRPSMFAIEGGEFGWSGSVDLNNDAYMDLELKGRKPDFKLITSFAPDYIYEKLQTYKNEGDVYFIGKVKGKALNDVPRIDMEFGCKNANFINPHNNKSVKDLNLTGFFTNGDDRTLETTELYIKNLSALPEQSVFKGSFHIKNFLNPMVSVDLHSRIDLGVLYDLLEIESLKNLTGKMTFDITIDELLDYNDTAGTLGKLKDGSDSKVILHNVNYKPEGGLPLENLNAEFSFAAGHLKLKKFDLKILDSDLSLKGEIKNLSEYIHGNDADVIVTLDMKSERLNLQQLAGIDEELTKLSFSSHFETSTKYFSQSDQIPLGEFFIDKFYCKLKHYPHTLHDFLGDILITPEEIKVKHFKGEIDKSDFKILGYVKNYAAFLPNHTPGAVETYIDITSKYLKFNDIMTYKGVNYLPEEYKDEALREFEIEAKLNMHSEDLLTGNFTHNTRLELRDLHGYFSVHPLKIRDVHADIVLNKGFLKVSDASGKIGTTDFRIDAELSNYFDTTATAQRGEKIKFYANRIDYDELFPYEEVPEDPNKPIDHDAVFNIFTIPFPDAEIEAHIGWLRYHKYIIQNLDTKLRSKPNHYLYVDKMHMDVAGGSLDLKGYFNGSDPEHIYLSSELTVNNLDINQIFYKFDNFGQDYLIQENIHGRLSGTVKSKALMHTDLTPNLKDTEAHIEVTITDGRLTNFGPFDMMARFSGDKDLNNVQFGEMVNVIDIKNGIITIPRMEVSTTLGYIFISGRKNFDLKMDYTIEVPMKVIRQAMWNALVGRKRKNKSDLEMEEEIQRAREDGREMFVSLQITGTPDNYEIHLGKGTKRREKGKTTL